jgi:hypothetical protein
MLEELPAGDLAEPILFHNMALELGHPRNAGGFGGAGTAPPIFLTASGFPFSHIFRASPLVGLVVEGDRMPFRDEVILR